MKTEEKPDINPALLEHGFICPPSVSGGCDCPSTSYSGGVTQLGLTNSSVFAHVAPGIEQFPHGTGNDWQSLTSKRFGRVGAHIHVCLFTLVVLLCLLLGPQG